MKNKSSGHPPYSQALQVYAEGTGVHGYRDWPPDTDPGLLPRGQAVHILQVRVAGNSGMMALASQCTTPSWAILDISVPWYLKLVPPLSPDAKPQPRKFYLLTQRAALSV